VDREVSNSADHESRGTGVAFPRAVKPCPDWSNPVSPLHRIGLEAADIEICYHYGHDMMCSYGISSLARVHGRISWTICPVILRFGLLGQQTWVDVIPSRHIPPTPIGPILILRSLSTHGSLLWTIKLSRRTPESVNISNSEICNYIPRPILGHRSDQPPRSRSGLCSTHYLIWVLCRQPDPTVFYWQETGTP
jgi:hypothetical protein